MPSSLTKTLRVCRRRLIGVGNGRYPLTHLITPSHICYTLPMYIEFNDKIWFWRGPAPWFFVTVPELESREIKGVSSSVTYGWGVIPVIVQIGQTEWQTSLFPKDGRYLVPLKASVRKAESLEEGDYVTVRLDIRL